MSGELFFQHHFIYIFRFRLEPHQPEFFYRQFTATIPGTRYLKPDTLPQAPDLQQIIKPVFMIPHHFPLISRLIFSISFLVLVIHSSAQPVIDFVEKISSGLSSPVDIVNANDGTERIFIVQQGGTIKVYDANFSFLKDFLVVSGISCCSERGLLSMAFHPQYKTNGYFFVYYTNASGGIEVARYHVSASDGNAADPSTKTIILTEPKPVPFSNHNGGKLNFGPDGNLYFGLGDGGSGGDPRNFAQRGDSLFGKMVRINVDDFNTPPYYTVPSDNPFVSATDTLHEIYAFGLRNPWRYSFDRLTGDMWLADVGQGEWEEVNYIPTGTGSGVNYGWHCFEGLVPYNGGCTINGTYIPPIFTYPHDATGGISVTGGYVYRGSAFPDMYGYYICADYNSGNGWLIHPDGGSGWQVTALTGLPQGIVSFGETEKGELLMATLSGTIYNVVSAGAIPVKLIDFTATIKDQHIVLNWTAAEETDLSVYEIEISSNGNEFKKAGAVPAMGTRLYSFNYAGLPSGKLYFRLKMTDRDNSWRYSKIISIEYSPGNASGFIHPSVIRDNMIAIDSRQISGKLQLLTADGKLVWEKLINAYSGLHFYPIPHIKKGIYIARLMTGNRVSIQRIIIP